MSLVFDDAVNADEVLCGRQKRHIRQTFSAHSRAVDVSVETVTHSTRIAVQAVW